MAVRERTLSEFLQHSGSVLRDLDEGEVLLRRRDGEDLILMTRRQNEALSDTIRAYFALAAGAHEAVSTVLPWFAFLSTADRAACIQELREVGSMAVHTGRLGKLVDCLYAWEATGLAAWDARDGQQPTAREDDAVDVPRPSR